MQYYGTRLSENISRRDPEGYLLCLNVPVARTGIQEYLPEELGLTSFEAGLGGDRKASHNNSHILINTPTEEGMGGDRKASHSNTPAEGGPAADRKASHINPCTFIYTPSEGGPEGDRKALRNTIQVYRPESEVFSAETIASFEGMPVTDNHPADGVTVDNIRALQKGHAHNVRRGAGSESDLLLADLIVTDPSLIDAILAGKREISCGYTYELCEENGRLIQRKIRGNHVAVVDAGRAGHRVSIRDHHPSSQPNQSSERSNHPMKKSLLKKLTRMARDGDPEAIEALAEAVEQIVENSPAGPDASAVVVAAETCEPPMPAAPTRPEEETVPAVTADSDALAAILERLDRLIALLTPAAPEPAADNDPASLPEELAEAVEEAAEAAETAEIPAEEIAAIVEEVVGEAADPSVSTVLEPDEEETDEDCPRPLETGDALRAAIQAIRPVLKRMPRRERTRVCADIAARLKHRGSDSRAYAALAAAGARRPAANPADLGRQIMASRNPNYKE